LIEYLNSALVLDLPVNCSFLYLNTSRFLRLLAWPLLYSRYGRVKPFIHASYVGRQYASYAALKVFRWRGTSFSSMGV
jgi:hypothetical protein